jgi:hypothetical protein
MTNWLIFGKITNDANLTRLRLWQMSIGKRKVGRFITKKNN